MKLLEEEEKEKREEEERKERKRTKEREKKLRRKERLKGKEKDRDKCSSEANETPDFPDVSKEELSLMVDEEPNNSVSCRDSVCEAGDNVLSRPGSPDVQDEQFPNGYIISRVQNPSYDCHDGEITNVKDGIGSFTVEQSKYSRRRSKFRKEMLTDPSLKWSDKRRYTVGPESGAVLNRPEPRCYGDSFETPRAISLTNRQLRVNGTKSINRHGGPKFNEKFHCTSNRMSDRYDFHSCSCYQNIEYGAKVEPRISTVRVGREKCVSKSDSALDMSKQFYRGNKYNQIDHMRDSCGRSKSKVVSGNNPSVNHPKKVWEPMESQKKYPRSNSDSDVTLKSSAFKVEGTEQSNNLIKSSADICSGESRVISGEMDKDNALKESRNSIMESDVSCQNGLHMDEQGSFTSKEDTFEEIGLHPDRTTMDSINSALKGTSDPIVGSTSSSDNCSSCLSEGDSITASSNHGNQESSSTSDSEYSSLQSEGKETSACNQNGFLECHEVRMEKNQNANVGEPGRSRTSVGLSLNGAGSNILGNPPTKSSHGFDNGFSSVSIGSQQQQSVLSPLHNQSIPYPVFQAHSALGYYHQNPVSWPAAPTNGLMPFPHPNHYLYAGPLGYGVNGNSRLCMQYSPLQHLATPLFAPGPIPIYQPIAKANGINLDDRTETSKPGAVQEPGNVANSESMDPIRQHSTQAQRGEGVQNDDSGKLNGNGSFSLFHFGGPVALSTGCESIPVPSKEEVVGDFSLSCLTDHIENDQSSCNKKETTVEEYNLFAASNGITFSFF